MGRRAGAALLTALLAFSQAPTKRMAGVVVDQDGMPVAGISIDHTGENSRTFETDAQGRFSIHARGPFVVLRKPGYESVRVAVEEREDAAVKMRRLAAIDPVPVCNLSGRYLKLEDSSASFRFPALPGVSASKQGRDIDYAARYYSVKTRAGRASIVHGAGPNWSIGYPTHNRVWESTAYSERLRGAQGWLIDARGRSKDGRFWRSLGYFGESAGYSDVDEMQAKLLDQVLDGVCTQ